MQETCRGKRNVLQNLDPRMKLLLVIVISTATLFASSQIVVACNYVIIIFLWLLSGEVKYAGKFLILFAAVLAIEYASMFIPNDTARLMISFLLFIIARSMSLMVMCLWMSVRLRVNDLVTALQNMHVPRGFTITIAVVFRYIPTISGEFRNINNTMKMRGINFNVKNLFIHPGRTMEYALIPLIMRSLKVADDLSASVMTRGLDLQSKRTSYHEVRLHICDFLITGIFFILIVAVRYLAPVIMEGSVL